MTTTRGDSKQGKRDHLDIPVSGDITAALRIKYITGCGSSRHIGSPGTHEYSSASREHTKTAAVPVVRHGGKPRPQCTPERRGEERGEEGRREKRKREMDFAKFG